MGDEELRRVDTMKNIIFGMWNTNSKVLLHAFGKKVQNINTFFLHISSNVPT